MSHEIRSLFYCGISMKGMFCAGDRMVVEPAALATLRPGDVIIYLKPDGTRVAHRVMKLVTGGVMARGDFSARAEVVLEEAVVGRVTQFERDGKMHRVRGGRWGMWRGRWLRRWNPAQIRIKRGVLLYVFPLGRPFYQWLRRSGLAARVWHPSIVRIQLETEQGPLIKFVVNGKHTVAYWWPDADRFFCRKPYDLIIHRPEL